MRITICTVLVWLAASIHATANAQAPLTVDIENWVIYNFDVSDPSRLATNPAVTPPPTQRNFMSYVMLADITAVAGKPVKGLMVRRGTQINVQTAPMPGQAIGDVTRGFLDDGILEFLQTDGTPIGTLLRAISRVIAPDDIHVARRASGVRPRSIPGLSPTARRWRACGVHQQP